MHRLGAAAEEAGISIEMLIEVRNEYVEANRTVTNMRA